MTSRGLRSAVLTALVFAIPAGTGCTAAEGEQPGAASASGSTAATPSATSGLAALLLAEVPSGLPRVPDDELDPPAGRKSVEDVAGYAPDAGHQRQVLQDYGYQWGWERFWRTGDRLTSVFLDQFSGREGAEVYADDLARNDAEYYGGVPDSAPAGLPVGCTLLTVDAPDPSGKLSGPAAFVWCAAGVFTVSVAVVSTSPAEARAEVESVTADQLDLLPVG
ncbi:hypothetical protein SAMN05661080_00795 [Modestobacter sp. DSM 44400]|uniref:hypothetical protein n=1 Tax=Modestobacter sp. DSM 44400 TaxID=1550230 RepID=UPI00089DA74A|nr:hypothetical protein [Modestobacter sp. DSM 44400]SDX67538.1 hypothetical protein SAMN05661080_00795 [Modestobacter sp. DSM 44400]